MSKLFENSVASLQLGIEDYESNDPRRVLSAVRNFYAGVLLLAEEALIRAAPKADARNLISARYKPVPDGYGGVEFEQDSSNTIDFSNIATRLKDFDRPIDQALLRDLNRIRNDVEHFYTDMSRDAVREAIVKAFPIIVQLFDYIREHPRKHLGEAWTVILDAKKIYDAELLKCRETL